MVVGGAGRVDVVVDAASSVVVDAGGSVDVGAEDVVVPGIVEAQPVATILSAQSEITAVWRIGED